MNTTLANKLVKGLEDILQNEFKTTPADFKDTKGKQYSSKLGPPLPSGNRYTTEEVLEMYVKDFIDEHRKLPGTKRTLERLFRNVAEYLIEGGYNAHPYTVKVKDAIAMPLQMVKKLRNVGKKSISEVNELLQTNYGLTLGMELKGVSGEYILKEGPEINGRSYTTKDVLSMTTDEFLRVHAEFLPQGFEYLDYFSWARKYLIEFGRISDTTSLTMREIIQRTPEYFKFTGEPDKNPVKPLNVFLQENYNLRLGTLFLKDRK